MDVHRVFTLYAIWVYLTHICYLVNGVKKWASSSVYYLLGLWSRLVTSVPYLKGDAPSLLDEFVPKITEGFITSRFDSVQVLSQMMFLIVVLFHFPIWLWKLICVFFFPFVFSIGRNSWWFFWKSPWQCRTSSGSAWFFPLSL